MNVVIYARFSSSGQREESIEGQVKICTEYAENNDYTVIGTYVDRALTGRNDKRPDLQRLLSDSNNNNFQAVIVYSIDRFGRNLQQCLTNENKLKQNGVALFSATEHFTNDPAGIFYRNLMMAHSQYYCDELSQKIRRGMDINAEKCLSTGGNIALGFKVDDKKNFQIDPDTAPIVQYIFESYASGKTVTEIINQLNSQGLKTSRGVPFNKNSLHSMLKNKRYIGIYTYKGTEKIGGMPRIISDELFNKVAEIMDKNRKAPARARAKVEYLLTTKMFCGYCKEMMTGFSGTGKSGKVYRYYVCNGTKKKACKKKKVNKEYIEDLVVNECRKLLTNENIKKIANSISKISESEKDTAHLKFLKKALSENERKHKNALNAIIECDLESVRKSLYEQIPILEKEHSELQKQIALEEKNFPVLTVPMVHFFLRKLKDGNVDDIKYRKTLINVFINKIYLYDDKLTIIFNSGDNPVTINDLLLSEIEDNSKKRRVCFWMGLLHQKKKRERYALFFCLLSQAYISLELQHRYLFGNRGLLLMPIFCASSLWLRSSFPGIYGFLHRFRISSNHCYLNYRKICITRLTSQAICGKMIINPEFLERNLS